jgi:hypothetical protein
MYSSEPHRRWLNRAKEPNLMSYWLYCRVQRPLSKEYWAGAGYTFVWHTEWRTPSIRSTARTKQYNYLHIQARGSNLDGAVPRGIIPCISVYINTLKTSMERKSYPDSHTHKKPPSLISRCSNCFEASQNHLYNASLTQLPHPPPLPPSLPKRSSPINPHYLRPRRCHRRPTYATFPFVVPFKLLFSVVESKFDP